MQYYNDDYQIRLSPFVSIYAHIESPSQNQHYPSHLIT